MKQLFFWGIILLQFSIYAQEVIPFTFRKQENLKGGLKIIGNNILSDHPANQPFDSIYTNDYSDMRYIDIDNDANTFSSSAATLSFTNSTCSKIRYAGLYWGGMYVKNDDSKKNIRIKIPSNPNYIDIQADSYIYNNHTSAFRLGHNPYICYKDVTDLLSEGTPSGEYIVANVKATQSNEGYVSGEHQQVGLWLSFTKTQWLLQNILLLLMAMQAFPVLMNQIIQPMLNFHFRDSKLFQLLCQSMLVLV